MYLLYCDETNLHERAGDFLICGGIMITSARSRELSASIDELRRRTQVPLDYQLKVNPGPKGFSHGQFIAVKQEALSISVEHRARLLINVVLHDVARSPDEARRIEINTACYHFDCILSLVDCPGLVLIDRFNDEGNKIDGHLREKFSTGLIGMPHRGKMRLSNIVCLHYSTHRQY
jgi:hypothetical protein